MPRFRVATYNAAYYEDPKKGARSDFVTLFEEADLVGFQEAGRRIDQEHIHSFPEFGVFAPANEVGTPIAYRKSMFELLDSGSEFLTPRTYVGSDGAGPSHMGEKSHNWVKLRHKPSGRIIYFGTDHLTPSIYIPARRRLHIAQSDGIVNWVKKVKNQVITVGDYNISATKDMRERDPKMPFIKFYSAGVVSTYKTLGFPKLGTHNNSFIDYVWYRLNSALTPVSQKVLTGLSSDHRALVVEFEAKLTRKKRLLSLVKK